MKNPNLRRILTAFSVFACNSHSKLFSLIARGLKNGLQAEKSSLNDSWKQKQKKLSKICEDLEFSSFKIKIGCLYLTKRNICCVFWKANCSDTVGILKLNLGRTTHATIWDLNYNSLSLGSLEGPVIQATRATKDS